MSRLDRLIPTKNGFALAAYYIGVFSLIPCTALLLAPLAVIFGVLGIEAIKRNPTLPGTAHAIAGIVLGSITFIVNILGIIGVIWLQKMVWGAR